MIKDEVDEHDESVDDNSPNSEGSDATIVPAGKSQLYSFLLTLSSSCRRWQRQRHSSGRDTRWQPRIRLTFG